MPGIIASVSLVEQPGNNGDVAMDLQAIWPLPIVGDYVIAPFVKVQERINAGHDLVPAIILLSVLLAWPHRNLREAARALAWGAAASIILITWMTSVHFAGLFEIGLQRVAQGFHRTREIPICLTQMLFFESGGQWLAALVCAVGIGLLTRDRQTSPTQVSQMNCI